MIKGIIFDFDGVIHDTFELAYSINKKINPEMSPDDYREFFNGNIYQNSNVTKQRRGLFFKEQNKEFKKLIIEKEIANELIKLSKSYELFIISSNMELALNDYLERNNVQIFKEVLGMETHKSKIEKFKFLMKKYSLNKNNCVFITDTLGDILEANQVDLNTIAVEFGFHKRKALEKGKPMVIVSTFSDIRPILNNMK